MSIKSLGTLTLDLIARIGGFIKPMDEATRKTKKNAKEISDAGKDAGEAWKSLAGIVGGAVAGISVTSIFSRMVTETRNAITEQAQLAAVLRSTGEAAGFTQGQLNSMADGMEAITTFAAGDINTAQTALLAFTNITGERFPRALQSAADMAARTGGQIQSTAEIIGRALDVPSQGMAALSRQGFRFTDSQKELMKQLESTGRIAEAQGIIFDALEGTYGGAAEAARNNLDGALVALGNTIGWLLTQEDGMPGLRREIEELIKILRDPDTKRGIDELGSLLAKAATLGVKSLAELGDYANYMSGTISNVFGNSTMEEDLRREIANIERALDGSILSALMNPYAAVENAAKYMFTSREELETLRAEKQAILDNLSATEKAKTSGGGTVTGSLSVPSEIDRPDVIYDAEMVKRAEALTRVYESTVASLERQNALTAEASELEKIRYEIAHGNLKGLGSDRAAVLESLANERDLQVQLAEEEKKRLDQLRELEGYLKSVRNDLMTDEERYNDAANERVETLNRALAAGLINEAEYGLLIDANTARLEEQIQKLKEKTEELDEFTKTAARSIQTGLSDAIVAGFDGGSDDLLKRWGELLKRMIADAVAADLTRSLFGMTGNDGQFGTGQLITGIGGIFAGMFDAGGKIPAGQFGIVGELGPEIVRGPATVTGRLETAEQLSGGNVQIGQMVFPGVTNSQEARKAAGAAGRELLAVISSAQRYT